MIQHPEFTHQKINYSQNKINIGGGGGEVVVEVVVAMTMMMEIVVVMMVHDEDGLVMKH